MTPIDDYRLITEAKHTNPHRVLGVFYDKKNHCSTIRLWRPGLRNIHVFINGKSLQMEEVYPGIFQIHSRGKITAQDYLTVWPCRKKNYDPYAFSPTITNEDIQLFKAGRHYQIYDRFGGRSAIHEGVAGAKFSVWAPNAVQVSICGDFNEWDPEIFPMRMLGDSGVWELFLPGIESGAHYKFAVKTKHGHIKWKSDPFALSMQKRPETHAILTGRDQYQWNDQKWQRAKQKQSFENSPMNVYEVHLGSWRKGEEEFYNYRELAPQLSAYCKEMGYTHIEILPITEHPLDESWGYQVTGFYTPTSRYGSLEDFQFFVDYFHQEGLGIILDWVPAHFPIDDYSLARFDGTYLFEHEDPRQGYHPHWNTLIFNYGKPEVVNFLIGSALFWLKKMHVDGLRVDAVASMLYLDYGRNEGEWLPNKWGGNENLEAIAFLKQLNLAVKEECCGVIMIAEESTTFPKITKAVAEGGLGFDMKWNLGWMNDSLRYFAKDPIYRKFHHKELCHTFSYAFAEKSMLVLSHDEVVHEKKSLFAKMPGDPWYKFANLRLLLGFMMCHPGKKLLFMGGELGQIHEWFCKEQLSWEVLKRQDHFDHFTFVKKLNHFYLKTPALWEQDFDPNSFAWLDNDDAENSVLSFFRKGKYNQIICVFNFTPVKRANYIIRMPPLSSLKEIFSSHSHKKNCAESPCDGKKSSKDKEVVIELDPLAFHIFEVNFD